MGSSIFIRGKKTKSRFLNTQKPFLNTKLCKMPYGIWKNWKKY